MEYQFEIRTLIEQPALCVRAHVKMQDLPPLVGRSFGQIGQYLVELRQPPAGMPYAAYRNMDAATMSADVEIGFPVGKALPGRGEIQPGTLPGGRAVATVHRGSYEGLQDAYTAMEAYTQANKLTPAGVWYEFYLNDPNQVAPEDVQTLVLMPIM